MTSRRNTHQSRRASAGPLERRSHAERRRQTRRALLDAALEQMDTGFGFDSLSLRRVTRCAGIAPAAFYRHFESMDELGLALMEESVATLHRMLSDVRADRPEPEHLIARSVEILVAHVCEHRRHFAFMAHARASGNTVLRHAIRSETKLFASELATDLSRFPTLRDWATTDLQMLASLFVDTMLSTIDSVLEASRRGAPTDALTPAAQAGITSLAERQLQLIVLAIPHWQRRQARPPAKTPPS